VQLLDGLVALPLDSRNRERLEWLAEEVEQAGGEASIWLAEAASSAEDRALAGRLSEAVAAEYRELIEAASAAREEPEGRRRRTLGRLRRELGRIRRRDYFPPPEREEAQAAVEALAQALEETPA
jgi:predicted urease superfamily metal-dependent hydrolase